MVFMPFLEKFAYIIKLFGGQNILIKGCMVFSGTKDGRRFISERRDRAAAVYLVFAGIKKEAKCVYAAVNYLNKARHKGRGQCVVRGYGADEPIGCNKSAAGKAQNRLMTGAPFL